jgi:hypothetical protein
MDKYDSKISRRQAKKRQIRKRIRKIPKKHSILFTTIIFQRRLLKNISKAYFLYKKVKEVMP